MKKCGHVKRSAWSKEHQPKKTGGKRKGTGPKPKDPTLVAWIYKEVDELIKKYAFGAIENVFKAAKKKDAPAYLLQFAAIQGQQLLEKRLPKQHDLPPGGITINIKSYVPGLESGQIEV